MGGTCGTHAEKRNTYRVLVGKTERDNVEHLRADWNIRLKRIFQGILYVLNWINLAQHRGQVAGCCEHCHKHSGSIKHRSSLKDSAPGTYLFLCFWDLLSYLLLGLT
jgi:hypothetical protein